MGGYNWINVTQEERSTFDRLDYYSENIRNTIRTRTGSKVSEIPAYLYFRKRTLYGKYVSLMFPVTLNIDQKLLGIVPTMLW